MGAISNYSEDEELVYKAEKNSILLLFISFLLLMGLFGFPSIFRSFVAIFQGNFIQENGVDFYIASVAFLFGWALPFIVFLLFANGELIVSSKKVYVNKGALGYQIEIPFTSISGIEQCSYLTRGGKQHYLFIYLYDGSKFKTDTHFSEIGLRNVVNILVSKGIQQYNTLQRKADKNINCKSDTTLYKKHVINPLVPILTAFHILLSVLLFIIVFTKFN